jgi:hypothetical protein
MTRASIIAGAAGGRRAVARAAAVATLAAVGIAWSPIPAAADLVEPAGACAGSAAFQSGGLRVDSATANPSEVFDVPRTDQVTWTGQVLGREPGVEREAAGSISLALPPPLGSLPIRDWSGTTTAAESSGIQDYDLPAFVPAGVVFRLHAEHYEGGELFCTATARFRIDGSPWSSPAIWVLLVLALGSAALLVVAGLAASPSTGRLAGAGVLGLLAGAFLGASLVLAGILPLESPVPLVAAIMGLVGGAAWVRWSPLRRTAAATIEVSR